MNSQLEGWNKGEQGSPLNGPICAETQGEEPNADAAYLAQGSDGKQESVGLTGENHSQNQDIQQELQAPLMLQNENVEIQ